MKRIISIFLSTIIIISCFSLSTSAYGKGKYYNGMKLTGINRLMYDAITSMAHEVSLGNRNSTKFSVSLKDLGLDGRYYGTDLGLPSFKTVDQITSNDAAIKEALINIVNYSPSVVAKTAMRDFPLDFFWADSAYRYSYSDRSYTYNLDIQKNEYYLCLKSPFEFLFEVAPPFAGNSDSPCYVFDTTKAIYAKNATTKALEIVDEAKNKTDYEKLEYYMQQIISLTDYNLSAARDPSYYDQTNPYELLWVFDDDPSTTVVCEGYAKAFQYLCDLTNFKSDEIWCYSATGSFQSSGSPGEHMWNIVHMDDGNNYLVDITNCDEGGSSVDPSLFMAPYSKGNVDDGYTFKNKSVDSYHYVYDNSAKQVFTTNELTICSTKYVSLAYDVNQDKAVDLKDVLAMRKYVCGLIVSNFNESIADLNNDKYIDMKDILFLRKYLASIH